MFKAFSIASILASICIATASHSATKSFAGRLDSALHVQLFEITTQGGAFSATTLSYAGGVSFDGDTILGSGFDPYLWLFDGQGVLIDEDDDGRGVVNSNTSSAYDSLIRRSLSAGNYTLALSRYGTFSQGDLVNGFYSDSYDLQYDENYFDHDTDWAVDLEGIETARLGSTLSATLDPNDDFDTDYYFGSATFFTESFDVPEIMQVIGTETLGDALPATSPVPIPAAFPLLAGGLFALGVIRRRRHYTPCS